MKYKIIKFKTINSTNTYALENLETLDDKTVITADVQTAGRGQFKRKWISENPNNLYFSLVLKNKSISPHTIAKTIAKGRRSSLSRIRFPAPNIANPPARPAITPEVTKLVPQLGCTARLRSPFLKRRIASLTAARRSSVDTSPRIQNPVGLEWPARLCSG